jgi:ribonuclease HI
MWVKALFKGKEVWAETDEAGKLKIEGALVAIRYSQDAGAKLYRAGAAGVELIRGEKPMSLDEGTTTPAAKAAAKTGYGSAGTRTQAQAQAAATDAKSLIASLPPETVLAFTDGSCLGNPGPAGAGVVVQIPGKLQKEAYRALGMATNNVGELTAILMALQLLDKEAVPVDAPVSVFTDSEYARGVLTLGWKAKANQALIEEVRGLIRKRPGVTLRWVAGHVGVAGNEQADRLAIRGAQESRRK